MKFMNSNNYNCLIKLAESGPVLPDFSDSARELMKLSPEVARKVLQQNPEMFGDADRAGLTRLLTEKPNSAARVLPELAKLPPIARNTVYNNNIPTVELNRAVLLPAYRPAPEPVKASFSPRALRELEKLSPTAALNAIEREFSSERLNALDKLSPTAVNNAIRREFPSLRSDDFYQEQARERYQSEYNFPLAVSKENPATGGYRITMLPEGGHESGFTGPLPTTHSMRQGSLPLTPSSDGVNPVTLRDARAQALAVLNALAINEANKRKVALNFDALFKDMHNVNLKRRQVGLTAYQPTALDVYAPYASTDLDWAAAENRALNDTAMSTITAEAARRGTPYNPAEINYMQRKMLPQNYQLRGVRDGLPFISPKMRAFGGGIPYDHTFKANNYSFLH